MAAPRRAVALVDPFEWLVAERQTDDTFALSASWAHTAVATLPAGQARFGRPLFTARQLELDRLLGRLELAGSIQRCAPQLHAVHVPDRILPPEPETPPAPQPASPPANNPKRT